MADAPAVTEPSVTLRIAVEGARRSGRTTLLKSLARQVDVPLRRIENNGVVLERLTYHAGLFEKHPLRLEVAAVTGTTATQRQLVGRADAVIYVIDSAADLTAPEAWLAGCRATWANMDDVDVPALMLFAHKQDIPGARAPDELLASLGMSPTVAVVATSVDGGGVRYGFALTVRACLTRIHDRDSAGRPRTLPTEPDDMLAEIVAGARPGPPPDPAIPLQPESAGVSIALATRRFRDMPAQDALSAVEPDAEAGREAESEANATTGERSLDHDVAAGHLDSAPSVGDEVVDDPSARAEIGTAAEAGPSDRTTTNAAPHLHTALDAAEPDHTDVEAQPDLAQPAAAHDRRVAGEGPLDVLAPDAFSAVGDTAQTAEDARSASFVVAAEERVAVAERTAENTDEAERSTSELDDDAGPDAAENEVGEHEVGENEVGEHEVGEDEPVGPAPTDVSTGPSPWIGTVVDNEPASEMVTGSAGLFGQRRSSGLAGLGGLSGSGHLVPAAAAAATSADPSLDDVAVDLTLANADLAAALRDDSGVDEAAGTPLPTMVATSAPAAFAAPGVLAPAAVPGPAALAAAPALASPTLAMPAGAIPPAPPAPTPAAAAYVSLHAGPPPPPPPPPSSLAPLPTLGEQRSPVEDETTEDALASAGWPTLRDDVADTAERSVGQAAAEALGSPDGTGTQDDPNAVSASGPVFPSPWLDQVLQRRDRHQQQSDLDDAAELARRADRLRRRVDPPQPRASELSDNDESSVSSELSLASMGPNELASPASAGAGPSALDIGQPHKYAGHATSWNQHVPLDLACAPAETAAVPAGTAGPEDERYDRPATDSGALLGTHPQDPSATATRAQRRWWSWLPRTEQ